MNTAHGLHYLSDESTHWCNCGREFKSRRGLWQHCHLAGNLDEARAKQAADKHGNVIALEGATRCDCGSKYWENDRCVDCGSKPPKTEEN